MDPSRERRLRGLLALTGCGVLVVAVLARPLGLDSQPGAGAGELLLGAAGIACVTATVLWRRTAAAYRWLAVTLVSTVVLLGVLELGARGVSTVLERERDAGLAALPAYDAEPWAATYWREHGLASRKRYVPYVGWRRRPFAGETITIDERGLRATPGARCTPGAFTVFVFGGSTVWGWGSPDALTMPARLRERLARGRPGNVCVVNYGEDAYVTTQHLVELVLELQAGRVPDAVVLSVGVNDADAAAANGRAVDHRYAARFAGTLEDGGGRSSRLLESSALASLARRVRGAPPSGERLRLDGVDTDALAADVLRAVQGATAVVRTLGAERGFDTYVVWHPTPVAGGKALTDEERSAIDGLDPRLVALYRAIYDRAAAWAAGDPRTFVATALFDDVRERVYLDTVHVTPRGNDLYAAYVATLIETD